VMQARSLPHFGACRTKRELVCLLNANSPGNENNQ
jgi:hypothetical protein